MTHQLLIGMLFIIIILVVGMNIVLIVDTLMDKRKSTQSPVTDYYDDIRDGG